MSGSRSQQAAHYGNRVERAIADLYDLDLDREYWRDGFDPEGDPVEIKAAMYRRSNGNPGRFRIFEDPHRELSRQGGYYVFAVYRVRGRGVEILRDRAVTAGRMSPEWGPSNHGSPNRSRQSKIPISEVFG